MSDPTAQPPAPFYYVGTDSNPPEGVPGYFMNPVNLSPAMVAWLFLTTNPTWLGLIDDDGNLKVPSAPPNANAEIAKQLGLTEGTISFIFKVAAKNPDAFLGVANAFQSVKDAGVGLPPPGGGPGGPGVGNNYVPPCPPSYDLILQLAPAAWVPDPGAPIPDHLK